MESAAGVVRLRAEKHRDAEGDRVTLVSNKKFFQFTPVELSWVAVKRREKNDIIVDLAAVLPRTASVQRGRCSARPSQDENRIELGAGPSIELRYLAVATGPELAFDEISVSGPARQHQIDLRRHHAAAPLRAGRNLKQSGPIVVGAVQGASCFGPAYEFAMIMDTDLRRRRIRDKVPMTFVTAEPYIGHLGVGGVGDTRGVLESEMRQRHIKWIVNAKVDKVDAEGASGPKSTMTASRRRCTNAVQVLDDDPGVPRHRAVRGIEGLTNPREFIVVDKYQCNPKFRNVFGVGVCIAIAPLEQTPVPCGVPKTGYMIESMVSASALNIGQLVRGQAMTHEATWNAICLADFGDSGVAFVAMPQNPPRNVNWASSGRWVHVAKVAFEKYFLHKVRAGTTEPYYEKVVMKILDIGKIKMPAA